MVSMNCGHLESDLVAWIHLLIVMGMLFTGFLMVIEGHRRGKGWPRILSKYLVGATVGIVLPDVFRWIIFRIGS
jgi:hypothetical protein